MTQNINVRMPPFLPTVPLPVGMVGGGMMYMYSCSQCDFKTHVEAMFKQHVDSVHLGISNAANNIILSSNNVIATATTGAVAVNPVAVTATIAGSQVPHAVVVATQAPGSAMTAHHKGGLLTVTGPGSIGGATITTVHKCPKCGFLAPSKNQLTQHRRKFHGKQVAMATYATQIQGAQIINAANINVTTTSTNASGKKTYTCSTCGYSTTRRDGLSQHYDSVHLKIKNHQCTLCPYAASQKGTLNRHVKLRHKKKDEILG